MEEEDCCDGGFLLPTPHRCYGDEQELTLQQSRAHWSSTSPSVTEALITLLIPTSFLMLKVPCHGLPPTAAAQKNLGGKGHSQQFLGKATWTAQPFFLPAFWRLETFSVITALHLVPFLQSSDGSWCL